MWAMNLRNALRVLVFGIEIEINMRQLELATPQESYKGSFSKQLNGLHPLI
jgi:hypothetical protein